MVDLMAIDEDNVDELEAGPATEADLGTLAEDVATMQKYEKEISELNDRLKEKQDLLKEVTDKIIPEKMMSLNIKSMKLFDGSELKIVEILGVSIQKAAQESAFEWLRDRDQADIIKNEITVKFGAEQGEEADEVFGELVNRGLTTTNKQSIHPQTLKAFVKEQRGKGVVFPQSFTIYDGLQAKIVQPKN